jgi:MFS family permease
LRRPYFAGWNVVAATFVMALFSFGLGFYGMTVHVAALQRLHGWSAAAVSAPVTVYYVAGALLTAWVGDLYERFGPRAVVIGGSLAMAAGLAALGRVTQPWQLYPAFLAGLGRDELPRRSASAPTEIRCSRIPRAPRRAAPVARGLTR